jgi:hypothetical protein
LAHVAGADDADVCHGVLLGRRGPDSCDLGCRYNQT